jgi:hypothetical protein
MPRASCSGSEEIFGPTHLAVIVLVDLACMTLLVLLSL